MKSQMIKISCAVSSFALVHLLCIVASAQSVSIAGRATDIDGNGVSDATVRALNAAGQTVGIARTGADGRYSIQNIQDRSASFRVQFSKVGRQGDTLPRVAPNATDASAVLPELGATAVKTQQEAASQQCCYRCRRCRRLSR